MGLDLSKSIGSPIISMFDKPNFVVSQVEKNETIEAAINATACYYVHPQKAGSVENRLYRNNNYYYIKACLECLRALYKNNNIAIEGYYDIYRKSHMHPFPYIQEDEIGQLIKMREMYSPTAKSPISLPDLFTNIILNYYKVDENSLYNLLLKIIQTSNALFPSFQNAIVVFVIAQSQQQKHKKAEYHSLLSQIILNMDQKSIKYYKEYEFISKVDWKFKDWLADDQFIKKIAHALYMFRYDYYKPLFYKNTGSRIIPDLKGS